MKTIAEILHQKTFPLAIFDSTGNLIYFEYSMGYCWKFEYDDNRNEIYYENSAGGILDHR